MPDFAAAYAQAHERLIPLLRSTGEAVASKTVVPACPLWTLKDLVAHLTDVSHSYAAGRHVYPVEIRDGVEVANLEGHVDELDAWTQEGVDARRDNTLDELLEDWDRGTEALCRTMRGDVALPEGAPRELLFWGAIGDLSTHTNDIRGALGVEADRDGYAIKVGFTMASFAFGLRAKDHANELPPLRIVTQRGEMDIGDAAARPTVEIDWFEMLRTLTSRRTRDEIAKLFAPIDATPYIPILASYALPAEPLPI